MIYIGKLRKPCNWKCIIFAEIKTTREDFYVLYNKTNFLITQLMDITDPPCVNCFFNI